MLITRILIVVCIKLDTCAVIAIAINNTGTNKVKILALIFSRPDEDRYLENRKINAVGSAERDPIHRIRLASLNVSPRKDCEYFRKKPAENRIPQKLRINNHFSDTKRSLISLLFPRATIGLKLFEND